jgi:glycosyltransferase 2 family protein
VSPRRTEGSENRFRWRTILKWVLILVALVFLGRALYEQWPAVRDALASVPVWAAILSTVAAAAAVTCSAEQQRALLTALGHRIEAVPWLRVFYLAQLGKYVPGTAWAYVAQMELARQRGVGRITSVLAMTLGAGLTVLLAFVAGAFVIESPGLAWIPSWAGWAVVIASAASVVILLVRPSIVGAVLRRAPSRLRGLGLDGAQVTSLALPVLWSALAWVAYGVHLWILMVPMGLEGPAGFGAALGGFALAWAIGFLVVFVPAGVGVREAVLVAVLAPLVGEGPALAAAVLSRFLIIVAEAALLAITPIMRPRQAGRREERAETPG